MNSKDSLEKYRNDFPALQRQRNGKPPVYFDNACTTLVPQPVIEAMDEYYNEYPSCSGGRSRHWFAGEVTNHVDGNAELNIKGARRQVADFINAASEKEIIFTMNTTHAINTVALGFKFQPGDVVLTTDIEHNSNLLPWLRLQKTGLIKVDHTICDADSIFDLDAFEKRLKSGRIRLVSLGFTSNVTGYTIPAQEIVSIAHRYGARVLLDGAQTVPHTPVDVRGLDVDFLAFSVHKMCGPKGMGVLYGKKELLGGGTVDDTTYESYGLLSVPERFEAGIQNYPGQIGSGVAAQYLQKVGLERISAHEISLNKFLTGELMKHYGDTGWFHILGPQDPALRGGVLSFDVRRPNALGISEQLSEKNNIMIRDGVFCVHSYFNAQFGEGWQRPRVHSEHRMIYRVSLYFYNTIAECRIFLDTLDDIFRERAYI
jgi:cysteine desulfurase/selenocysteine lyase